jgi:SPP1 family holin
MNRTTGTIIRTAVLALALTNQILTAAGISPLPIGDADIETLISSLATVLAAVWAWWKNNSITGSARQADQYLDALKERGNER